MTDFSQQIVAEAIDYLVHNYTAQPDLDAMARRAGYEPTYFQKLFKDYVGISPKRLVQYMSARHARELLMDGASTLETAQGAGLSGNARLHDLFVSVEGATPGEVKNRGQGLEIIYGFHPSPLGALLVAKTGRGVCYLGFLIDQDRAVPVARVRRHFPLAVLRESAEETVDMASAIMAIWRGRGDAARRLKLDLHGTNLQIQVWLALLKIPSGETATYSDIAGKIGRPKAARAIGNAVGANPVSLLVPCHRVIRATGIIDNYGWGSPRKKLILGMEGAAVSGV